jgi:hypothetical protein
MEITGYLAFASFTVAAASFLFTYLDKRKDRHRRILVETTKVTLIPEAAGFPSLGLTHGGAPLGSPSLYIVTATNIGQASLKATDIEKPLTVRISEGRIVEAEISFLDDTTSQPEIFEGLTTGPSEREIQAPKTLLNRGDAMRFRFITDGAVKPPVVSLRANDFEIASAYRSTTIRAVLLLLGTLGALSGLLAVLPLL